MTIVVRKISKKLYNLYWFWALVVGVGPGTPVAEEGLDIDSGSSVSDFVPPHGFVRAPSRVIHQIATTRPPGAAPLESLQICQHNADPSIP